jgi:cbb3-type cytochrome oxidase maturation protein
MNVIFVLISASLIVAVGFLAAFIWSVKSGQFEDDYTPSVRILFDDKQSQEKTNTTTTKTNNN